jgi:hypothetical protein
VLGRWWAWFFDLYSTVSHANPLPEQTKVRDGEGSDRIELYASYSLDHRRLQKCGFLLLQTLHTEALSA